MYGIYCLLLVVETFMIGSSQDTSDLTFLEENLLRVREDVSMLWSAIMREKLSRSKDIENINGRLDVINSAVESPRQEEGINYRGTGRGNQLQNVDVSSVSAKLGQVLKAFGLEKKRIARLYEEIHTLKQTVSELPTDIFSNEPKGMVDVEEKIQSVRMDLEAYVDKAFDARSHADEVAHAYCAAMSHGWAFSIRRHCEVAPTCETICAQASAEILASIGNQRSRVKCVDAFTMTHRGDNSQGTGEERGFGHVGYLSYSYGPAGCQWRANHCGPRYCCCVAY